MNEKNIINEKNFWQMNQDCYDISDYEQMQDGYEISDGPGYTNAHVILNIKDFPEAVAQFERIYETTQTGVEGLKKMKHIIETLPSGWKGSDANVHISHLIHIKVWLALFTSNIYEITCAMYQQLRSFNNTIAENQGKPFDMTNYHETDISHLLVIESDPEVYMGEYFNHDIATQQYQNLLAARNLYEDFCQNFFSLASYLFDIWQSGGSKDKFEKNIESFQTQLRETFDEYFHDMIKDLNQAIENWRVSHFFSVV